ncbi:hypothetical protein ACVWZ4_007503 [Bradyrhizobium sp. USDA 4472]
MSLNTTAVRIKVTLKDVKPEVMRRLVVPVTLRLDRLHLTLQEAFGWTNSHLFEFFAGEVSWGIPDPHNDYGHHVNADLIFPKSAEVKFPTQAGSAINRRHDRYLHFSVAALGA